MWPRLSSAALRPFLHRLQPRGIAAAYATAPTPPLRQRSVDDTEALQVELLMPDDGDGDGDPMSIGLGPHHSHPHPHSVSHSDGDAAAETITVVDAFARAKVANFVRRIAGEAQQSALVRAVQSPDGDGLFHARLPLPVPPEYGARWGEGLAPTAKEAELVAAMHAERVIDALGLPMFQLTSKQRRHAEAARAAGRWAPLPGDAPLPGPTPSPPRLHLVREGAALAGERRLGIDKMTFVSVTPGAFTPMRLTLASPFLLDHGSVFRIKQFFAAYDCAVPRYSRVTALHKLVDSGPNKSKGSHGKCEGNEVQVPDSEKMFVAQLRLPIDARFGERIGYGKAPVRRDAIALACMHAELIIDALGLALYPSSRERQAAHAAECRKVNRWCAEPGSCEYHYTRESPPALQMSHSSADSTHCVTAAESGAGASLESRLLSHTAAIDAFDCVTEVPMLVPAARREFADYLARYSDTAADVGSPFFIETLGIPNHHTYRATATVPVPDVASASPLDHAVPADEVVLTSFVAIGISTTEASAEIAASMHALAVLESLGRRTYDDSDNNNNHKDKDKDDDMTRKNNNNTNKNSTCAGAVPVRLTRATPLPPPCRFVRSHVGRVLVPGLTSPAWRAGESGMSAAASQQQQHQEQQQLTQLRAARANLPLADWSLAADADGRIIVSPDVRAGEGRNYVHTLPAVRCPDAHALVRLRDFLERHGKRLESALTVSCGETEEGLRRFTAVAALPVPAAVGRRRVTARGEAYTEEDARVMCAVHAELLLDALGVALYDHAGLQCKHSDAARLLGRWAPPPFHAYSPPPRALSDGPTAAAAAALGTSAHTKNKEENEENEEEVEGDDALQLPPPVRKEHSDSCVWARLVKIAAAAAAAHKNAVPSAATNAAATSEASSLSSSPPPPSSSLDADATAASLESPSSHSVPPPPKPQQQQQQKEPIGDDDSAGGGVGVPSDDVLCDPSRLTSLHPSEIFRNAPRVIEQYCRRNGADLSRLLRQYSVLTPTHGRVHRTLLELPLPASIGRRYAVAVAETKKDAYALCCMHATLILDSLGIALYSDAGRQAAHAAAARARGRTAASPGSLSAHTRGRCTHGLKSLSSDTTDAPPSPPQPPQRADCCRPHVWAFYIRACRAHIAKRDAYILHRALFTERRAPRYGVGVEDTALDAVEALPLFTGARAALPRRCAALGLPPPPPLRYEPHGTPPHRRFLVEQPIIGTPFVARGAGDDGPEAVARAAMHYVYIIDTVAAGSSVGAAQPMGLSPHTAPAAAARGVGGGGGAIGGINIGMGIGMGSGGDPCGTARGALGVMALYAAACPPFRPLRATLRERHGPSLAALLEYEDASGLRMAGAGEAAIAAVDNGIITEKSREEAAALARARAAMSLCQQLQRHAAFQAVSRVARAAPLLCAESAALFAAEAQVAASVAAALDSTQRVALAPPVWGEGEKEKEREGAAALLTRCGDTYGAAMDSPERRMLLDAARTYIRNSIANSGNANSNANSGNEVLKPLAPLPASARRLFAAMGLTTTTPTTTTTGGGGGGGGVCSDVGAAVALLTLCVPPSAHNRNGPDGGAMPLQLALLLLTGALAGCGPQAVRAVAVALTGTLACAPLDSEGTVACSSIDSEGEAEEMKAEVARRVAALAADLKRVAPGNPLGPLLASMHTGTETAPTGTAAASISTTAPRLCLVVAAAAFPRVLVQRRACAADGRRSAVLSAISNTTTATTTTTATAGDGDGALRLTFPPRLAEPSAGRSHHNTISSSSSSSSGNSTISSSNNNNTEHCALPLVVALDAAAPSVFGVFVSPAALLLAAALGGRLRVADDVPTVAVLDDRVPVVVREAETLAGLVRLREELRAHWAALRPLPPPLQRAVDVVFAAEHTLAHVAQAGLLLD